MPQSHQAFIIFNDSKAIHVFKNNLSKAGHNLSLGFHCSFSIILLELLLEVVNVMLIRNCQANIRKLQSSTT